MKTRDEWHESRYGGRDQRRVDRAEQALLEALLSPLAPNVTTCLDAPAGYGRLCETAARALGIQKVVALDHHVERLRACASAYRVLADLRDRLPFDERSFDLVLCIRYLQHVREPEERDRALERLCAASRRYVLLSYYRTGTVHGAQRWLLERLGLRARPLATVDPEELEVSLRLSGFVVRENRALWPGVHAQHLLLAERAAVD